MLRQFIHLESAIKRLPTKQSRRRIREQIDEVELLFGHKRYGDEPYLYHLLDTADILCENGFDTLTWILAGLHHDTLEDTDWDPETLADMTGSTAVMELVQSVSGLNGEDRSAHCEHQYALIELCPAAAILKLADRTSNVRNIFREFRKNTERYTRLAKKYHAEHKRFAEVIYPKVPERMWQSYLEYMTRVCEDTDLSQEIME